MIPGLEIGAVGGQILDDGVLADAYRGVQRAGPAGGVDVHVEPQLDEEPHCLQAAAAGRKQHRARALVGPRSGVRSETEQGPQHVHVAGLGGGQKGREAAGAPCRRGPIVSPSGARVQIGPAGDERPNHVEIALPHRGMQRRAAGAVPDVDVGALIEHQPGDGVAAGGDGQQEGGAAVGGGDVGVGPGRDQRPRARGVPLLRREQDGPEAVAGDRVDVVAALHEQAGDGRMPAGDGPHQRRLAHARLGHVHIGAPVEQQPHQHLVAAVHRGQQRRVTAPAGGVHVRAGIEEQPGERQAAVGAGEQQRGLAVLVRRVGIGPRAHQDGGDAGVAAKRGPRQRGRAVGADGVDVRPARDERLHRGGVASLHGLEQPCGRARLLRGSRWRARQREDHQDRAGAVSVQGGHDGAMVNCGRRVSPERPSAE